MHKNVEISSRTIEDAARFFFFFFFFLNTENSFESPKESQMALKETGAIFDNFRGSEGV